MDKCDWLSEKSQQLLAGLEKALASATAKSIITVEKLVGRVLNPPYKPYGPQPYVGLQFSE
jgi:hypothetical protein